MDGYKKQYFLNTKWHICDELTVVVTIHTRSVKVQVRPDSKMRKKGWHYVPTLAKELLQLTMLSEGKSVFFRSMVCGKLTTL